MINISHLEFEDSLIIWDAMLSRETKTVIPILHLLIYYVFYNKQLRKYKPWHAVSEYVCVNTKH